MKKIFQIVKSRVLHSVFLSFVLNFTFAQSSSLSIVSDHDPFILTLNSMVVNAAPNKVVVAPGLNAGKNYLRLTFSKKGVPEINAQIEVENDGKSHQVSYKVVPFNNGPYALAFVSDVVPEENSNNVATTQRQESQSSNTTIIFNAEINENTSDSDADKDDIDINASMEDNSSDKSQINISINASESGTSRSSSTSGRVPQVANGLACPRPSVNSKALMQLKYKISQATLDLKKAKEAKDFINLNCLTSAQVADLVKLMKLADTQLDIAQFAFMHTYDQSKYEIVVNALRADYSKKKLLNYIGSYEGEATSSNQNSENQSEEPVREYPTPNAGRIPMSSDSFSEALEAVDDPINEDSKMEIAKSVFDKEYLSTDQVLLVVDLFINEDRKLTFAKWAFSRTSDKDKYFRINKAFINEQGKTDLSQFVKNNK